MANTHGLTKGSILTINRPNAPLDGVKAKFIRQSERTGKCTVELLEDWKECCKGDRVVIDESEMS